MLLLWGGLGIGLVMVPEAYENRESLLRTVPLCMRFQYQDTEMYWSDLLYYLQNLNDRPLDPAILDEAPSEPPKVPAVTDSNGALLPPDEIDAVTDAAKTQIYTNIYDPTETTFVDETAMDGELAPPAPPENLYDYSPALYFDVEAENLYFTVTRDGTVAESGDEALARYGYGAGLGLGWLDGELYVLHVEEDEHDGAQINKYPARENYYLREFLRDYRRYDELIAGLDPAVDIMLIPSSRIVDAGGGALSNGMRDTYVIGIVCWGILALIVLDLLLFLGVAIDHRSKRAADAAIGRLWGKLWLELRLGIYALAVTAHLAAIFEDLNVGIIFAAACGWFWLYLAGVDLRENGLATVKCNLFASIIKLIRRRQSRRPLHKAMTRRIWVWGIPALLFALIALMFFGVMSDAYGGMAMLYLMFGSYATLGALIFIILYFRSRDEDYRDIAAISARIIAIREGKASDPLTVPANHRFSPTAEALESIYLGIEQAVTERTRSERTKIEMVTNISHDLKTPLTSIVGYANLLSEVEGLPPEAQDYVAVIMQKSARLNGLIKDLFELSKATTNDLTIHPEPLDLTRLCNQLLAEQADAIAAAPVTVVTSLPDHECRCINDGAKLYRVFANLLENALRYSLEGSRIFLSLRSATSPEGSPLWRLTVKNTSREYIDFTADEILGRFVRGDRNRTTEGNGLGLPIAKSFTELCGGRFYLDLDGDIFAVTVDLPAAQSEEILPAVAETNA